MMNISSKSILQPYINEGRVDYRKLRNDESLAEIIASIENASIENMTYAEEFSFWLNAYNFLTLSSVLKRLAKKPSWRGNIGIWSKIKFFILEKHKVGGKKISLYSLENKILRKKFADPRIHFALNCASMGCPVLPGKMFDANILDEYLDELTSDFINANNVRVEDDTLYVSSIFKMYKNDFSPSILEFIQKYYKGDLSSIKSVKFLPYDWSINSC